MDKTFHPNCQKKIHQLSTAEKSDVKVNLRNLLNYTTLTYIELLKINQINLRSTQTNHGWNLSSKLSKKIHQLSTAVNQLSNFTFKITKSDTFILPYPKHSIV